MPALTLQKAEANKYGLAIKKYPNRTYYVLYDTQYLIELFHKVHEAVKKQNKQLKTNDQLYITGQLIQSKYLRNMKKNIVVSTLVVEHEDNHNTVGISAAENSAGPLIYDIAMSHTGRLMSDRSNVSNYAYRIWNYYFVKRKDVEKQKVKDSLEYCDQEDGTTYEVLNYEYSLIKPIDTSRLKKNHHEMILWIGRNIPKLNMSRLADEFFDELYDY
jgi:CHAT domain-containing protein